MNSSPISKMVWHVSVGLTVLDRRPNPREQDWRSQVGNHFLTCHWEERKKRRKTMKKEEK